MSALPQASCVYSPGKVPSLSGLSEAPLHEAENRIGMSQKLSVGEWGECGQGLGFKELLSL